MELSIKNLEWYRNSKDNWQANIPSLEEECGYVIVGTTPYVNWRSEHLVVQGEQPKTIEQAKQICQENYAEFVAMQLEF